MTCRQRGTPGRLERQIRLRVGAQKTKQRLTDDATSDWPKVLTSGKNLSLSKYVEPERGVVRWGGSELFVGQRLSTHRGRHGLPGRQPKCGAPTQIAKRKIGVIAGAALEGSQRRRKAGVYCAAGLRRGFAELEEKRPRRVPAGAQWLKTAEIVAVGRKERPVESAVDAVLVADLAVPESVGRRRELDREVWVRLVPVVTKADRVAA